MPQKLRLAAIAVTVAVVVGMALLLAGCGHVRGLMQLGGCQGQEDCSPRAWDDAG